MTVHVECVVRYSWGGVVNVEKDDDVERLSVLYINHECINNLFRNFGLPGGTISSLR